MYTIIKSNLYKKIQEIILNNDTLYKTIYNNTKQGINIKKLVIHDCTLYENIINKKVEQKFNKLIEFLINLYENETDDGTGTIKSLTEIEKFKQELKNKYKNYMTKKQKAKAARKIMIMEEELKKKLLNYQKQIQIYENHQKYYNEKENYEDEIEKDTHRKR